nr:DoxX family protein [Propionibacterium sp.]
MAFSLFKKTEPAAAPAPRPTVDVPVVNGILDVEPLPVVPAPEPEASEPAAEAIEPAAAEPSVRLADDLATAAALLSGAPAPAASEVGTGAEAERAVEAEVEAEAEDETRTEVEAETEVEALTEGEALTEADAPTEAGAEADPVPAKSWQAAEWDEPDWAEPASAVSPVAAEAPTAAVAAVAPPPSAPADPVSAEQARLERERAARREARLAALAPVKEDDPLHPAPAPTAARPVAAPTHRPFGSFGLFLLRAVTAVILFVHGLNGVINPRPVLDVWTNTILPYPRYVALGVSWLQLALALLLLFGLLTRFAGLLLAGLMAATLAFVMWGSWSIFEPGGTGFIGEYELLLAAVGIALLTLGGGAWSFDHLLRRNREQEGLDG